MSQTPPPTVTALGTPPSTSNPSTFSTLADALLGALPTMVTQLNALGTNIYNNCVDAYNNAVAALSSQTAAASSAAASAASAASAAASPGTTATSTSSLTLQTGTYTQNLTIQTGKTLAVGQTVVIAYTATPSTQMTGTITSYNSGTGALAVLVTVTTGTGTQSSWSISLSAPLPSIRSAATRNAMFNSF